MVGFGLVLNLSWVVTLIAFVAIFIAPSKNKGYVAAILVAINALATSWLAIAALQGDVVDFSINAGSFLGSIPIRIDGLSAWFILIINFTCITGVIYGIGYLKGYSNAASKLTMHWILFGLFHLSMVWVCMLQNAFAFLIAWEVMSLSSMMLVIFDHHNPKTLKAGMNYLVQMHISVVFLTIGFIWVYFQTGSLDFNAFHIFFGNNSNIWLFVIFFIGFGLKAGFIPLHSWLPHAHPAAPSHVSGVMSGVIVKLGIYGIFRVISYLSTDYLLLGEIVITISVLTGLYGILNAAVHRDFKRMLAYCTIENIGIIGIGIGIGLIGLGSNMQILYFLGFGGALLHVLNHSLFKSLLFYSAGSVYQQTHTRDMDKLGGLIKVMPKTAVTFLVGAIAIGGIPPFNGFVSEFLIYNGLIDGLGSGSLSLISLFVLTFAGLSIIGGLSILTFTKTFGTIFLGSPRQHLHQEPREVSSLMLIPQYVIIAVMLSVAFIPQLYLGVVGRILSGFNRTAVGFDLIEFNSYSTTIAQIGLYFAGFVALIGLFLSIRWIVSKSKPQRVDATWGCAYTAPNTRMQYSGKSFSKPLGKTFNFLLLERKKFTELEPGEIFPTPRKYASYYHDFFESRFISLITNRLVYTANYFRFIQNGRTQTYVLYGIVFVMAIFILTVLNIIR
ncbi:proton-conducting transporter transmembrane domain-containing protein [Williamwhitmania taraxaci]|uniref:Formate hydrogenlyase subunit 3/Multisubunit Na+/H+ antiporter, MnhD subunit n=1 Tax=Williamwhitmania taraxaci TaxID=1640674 RepID=A0A1G6MRT0_9BACT|nr:proton-conducting transporter membrane subunit [Williamwhitmania taraxaci]SDC58250.1 Formate hydrogenlyase subunit 3/Multisubunit Na+/H+ antiporter, MnhD subunit [Williamwhitmania taraxaci]